MTEAGLMHEAGYVTLSRAPLTTSHWDIYNMSIFLFWEVLLVYDHGF